ncbi:hypothetical protein K8T06_12885 [bacterium]|nr:hypothetical protein [bacterium]
MKQRSALTRSGTEILEESIDLLRKGPMHALAAYYVGTLPFIMGVIVFWSKMSRSPQAFNMLPAYSFFIVAAFSWMKAWQNIYAWFLMDYLQDTSTLDINWKMMVSQAVRQTIIHGTSFLILPLSLLLAVPFGHAYAFYQSVTVIDRGGSQSLRDLIKSAFTQAGLWPRQNFTIIWLLSPFVLVFTVIIFLVIIPVTSAASPGWTAPMISFYASIFALILIPLSPLGIIITINIATSIMMMPQLVKMLLGVESFLTQNPNGMMNTSFFALVTGLTVLVMDPVLKAAYVSRCFYGDSIKTGADIRVSLKKFSCLLIVIMMLFGVIGGNQTSAAEIVDTETLDRTIENELQKDRYAWKLPYYTDDLREKGAIESFFASLSETIGSWMKKIFKWISNALDWMFDNDGLSKERSKTDISKLANFLKGVIVFVLLILALALVYQIIVFIRGRNKKDQDLETTIAVNVPDVASEETSAIELPENEWVILARELAGRGEYRLALRALYLSILAWLGHTRMITLAHHKSNKEYWFELRKHATDCGELLEQYRWVTRVYESVWYGRNQADQQMVDDVLLQREDMVDHEQ